MYRYETHVHSKPVSRCARVPVEESMAFYKSLGYDGIFLTNHFLDANIGIEASAPYEEKIEFYFSDYERALTFVDEIGIRVFSGVELGYKGTDFLVYGLDKAWYLAHPEIMEMKKTEELPFMMEAGALTAQAHPYREANYIDHIRLLPRSVQAVEIVNANRTELENRMAADYCRAYGLIPMAGSDNHSAAGQRRLAGMEFETPLRDEKDFCARILAGEGNIFTLELPAQPAD